MEYFFCISWNIMTPICIWERREGITDFCYILKTYFMENKPGMLTDGVTENSFSYSYKDDSYYR
jgi:hypothetical protein